VIWYELFQRNREGSYGGEKGRTNHRTVVSSLTSSRNGKIFKGGKNGQISNIASTSVIKYNLSTLKPFAFVLRKKVAEKRPHLRETGSGKKKVHTRYSCFVNSMLFLKSLVWKKNKKTNTQKNKRQKKMRT